MPPPAPVSLPPDAFNDTDDVGFKEGRARVGLVVVMANGRWMIDDVSIVPEVRDWSEEPI